MKQKGRLNTQDGNRSKKVAEELGIDLDEIRTNAKIIWKTTTTTTTTKERSRIETKNGIRRRRQKDLSHARRSPQRGKQRGRVSRSVNLPSTFNLSLQIGMRIPRKNAIRRKSNRKIDLDELKRVVLNVGDYTGNYNKKVLTRIAQDYFGYSKSTRVRKKCLYIIRNNCRRLNFDTDVGPDHIHQDAAGTVGDTIDENMQGRMDAARPDEERVGHAVEEAKASEETGQGNGEYISNIDRHSWQIFTPRSPLHSLSGISQTETTHNMKEQLVVELPDNTVGLLQTEEDSIATETSCQERNSSIAMRLADRVAQIVIKAASKCSLETGVDCDEILDNIVANVIVSMSSRPATRVVEYPLSNLVHDSQETHSS